MHIDIVIKIIILILLIACSAFFSMSETALTSVSRIRMRQLADDGDKRARLVLKMTDRIHQVLSAILIGNNIANLSASALMTSLAISFFGSRSVGIATGILTFLILIFGEIAPKTMAAWRAERISMKVSRVIYAISVVLRPVVFAVNQLAGGVCRIAGVDTKSRRLSLTESDLRTYVDVGLEHGAIEEEENEMLHNVFDFDDAVASQIMIPRVDIVFVQADMDYEQVLHIFREEKFTRLPVYEDTTDDVVGILNIKDLLMCDPAEFSLRDTMYEPFFTFEKKNIAELFVQMRSSSISIAIVVDEYGLTAGLITIEDLIEEIVGEIYDEYDRDDEKPVVQIGEGEYLIDASLSLDDLNDQLSLELSSEDYDSIGGYMIGLLDHIPRLYESVTDEHGIYLQVHRRIKNRIKTLRIRLPE